MVTGVGWLIAFIVLHVGLWCQREQTGGKMPWLALAMAVLEVFVLGVGGYAWGGSESGNWAAAALAVVLCDRLLCFCSTHLPASLSWPERTDRQGNFETLITAQVTLLVGFTTVVITISWRASSAISRTGISPSVDFLVVLILIMSFLGVAIAGWTVFPQITTINNARQAAEALSEELNTALKQIQQTQLQMVQQEKLSSLGQLVAGVAHEINNPVSFIHGNLVHAEGYVKDLLALIELYQRSYPNATDEIAKEIKEIDLEFLSADLPKVLESMTPGHHSYS